MGKNDATYVGIGKPIEGGAVFFTKFGTEVPTNAKDELSDDYTCTGYVSSDGFSETTDTSVEEITAWGGDTVARPQTDYSKTYGLTLIETTADSLKLTWGENNVTENADGTLEVQHTTKAHPYVTVVVDILLSDGWHLRKVVEKAQVTEVGDITYQDGEAVGYELTIGALPVESVAAHDYYWNEDTDSDAAPTSLKSAVSKATTKSSD